MVHVERAIREAHMRKGQIDEIVLVGGSTRIPRLKEILREAFPSGTKICETIHPDEAVAYGAAVISAVLTGVEEVQDMRMNDMIPLSIGIECKRNYMSVMIKRGTYFPCKHTMVYQNTHDFQTVIDISIYEGERALCAANNHLGNISMSIEPRRRGETIIEVTLEVDHNGILQVTAVDVNTKAAISAPILYDHCTYTRVCLSVVL
ncbi:unnamed protein product [Caenorhabditis auriculariae]|uniref:Uncharacterized protein n=1 Tax=Caenorhabditis auriculariae TaxID=2777116 RepID=A0A8S1HGW5_9PELO|nr:unnamed protein product [Caenorhabditis auriculariae]